MNKTKKKFTTNTLKLGPNVHHPRGQHVNVSHFRCQGSHVTCSSQAVRARKLTFLKKGSPPLTCPMSYVICHVSCIMCHMSHVICHMWPIFFLTAFLTGNFWCILDTLDLKVSFEYSGPSWTHWIPLTFSYLFSILDLKIAFGYIGPFGTHPNQGRKAKKLLPLGRLFLWLQSHKSPGEVETVWLSLPICTSRKWRSYMGPRLLSSWACRVNVRIRDVSEFGTK